MLKFEWFRVKLEIIKHCSGQITAGIATLVVAFFMNYTGEKISLCKRYGKNKSWHLVGTICVLATFPVIFVMGQSEVCSQ